MLRGKEGVYQMKKSHFIVTLSSLWLIYLLIAQITVTSAQEQSGEEYLFDYKCTLDPWEPVIPILAKDTTQENETEIYINSFYGLLIEKVFIDGTQIQPQPIFTEYFPPPGNTIIKLNKNTDYIYFLPLELWLEEEYKLTQPYKLFRIPHNTKELVVYYRIRFPKKGLSKTHRVTVKF